MCITKKYPVRIRQSDVRRILVATGVSCGYRHPGAICCDHRTIIARVLRALVTRLVEADSQVRVVVLGDFNDSETSGSLQLLAPPLVNLTERLSPEERYTYVYRGNSQALDHILVTRTLAEHAEYEVVHINAEFVGAASDHDPVVARFTFQK